MPADLFVNLLAAAIAAVAGVLVTRLNSWRRRARRAAFLGTGRGGRALIAVPHHAVSPMEHSVHDLDVAAMVELATSVRACGGDADLVLVDEGTRFRSARSETEFCVGGPEANPRMAEHLRTFVPGVTVESFRTTPAVTIRAGDHDYERELGKYEYVVLARVPTDGKPVFLVCGQTALTNRGAARFLHEQTDALRKRFGEDGRFCLILRLVNTDAYGDRFVEEVADVTATAFAGALAQPTPAALPRLRRRATWWRRSRRHDPTGA